jgi:hypothetical protein
LLNEQVRQQVLESPGAFFSVMSRGVEIITSLGFYWATLSYDCLIGRGEEMVPWRAEQLRNLLCNLGPSFIKAGQVNDKLILMFVVLRSFPNCAQCIRKLLPFLPISIMGKYHPAWCF